MPVNLQLLRMTKDNAKPSWTTFVVKVLGGGNQSSRVASRIRKSVSPDILQDVSVNGREVSFAVSSVTEAKKMLEMSAPEIAQLMVIED